VGPDAAYPAEIAVRLGPMKLTYSGTVRLNNRDAAARQATMVADVREVRGQGAARARMSMTVSQDGESGSRVASVTDVELSGRAAQMGAGIVDDLAQRLVAEMAANLEKLLAASSRSALAAPATAASPASVRANRPISGLRLLLRALWHRLRRGRRQSVSETN
jgi:carbon monoxide dehydrogenase subunit G